MREGLNHIRIIKADAPLGQRVNQLLIHAVRGAQLKLALQLIEHIDCASLRGRKVHRFGDDGREHGLEIERRVYGLRHLAKRAQLSDRLRKLLSSRLNLIEQSGVLNRDHRLVSKGSNQLDLLLVEWLNPISRHEQHPDRSILSHEGDARRRSPAANVRGFFELIFRIAHARR